MGKEFSRLSQVRRAAIFSMGMAGGVELTLLAIFGLFDDAIEMRMYRNCLRAHPTQSVVCMTEDRVLRYGFYIP